MNTHITGVSAGLRGLESLLGEVHLTLVEVLDLLQGLDPETVHDQQITHAVIERIYTLIERVTPEIE